MPIFDKTMHVNAAVSPATHIHPTFHTPQVGISVAALAEVVKRLGLSQRHLTTGEVVARWLLPPTHLMQCRWGGGGGGGGGRVGRSLGSWFGNTGAGAEDCYVSGLPVWGRIVCT